MYKTYKNILFQIVIPFRPNIYPVKISKMLSKNNKALFHLHFDINNLHEIYTHKNPIKNFESTSIIEIEVEEIEVSEIKEHFIHRNLKVKLIEFINIFIDNIRYTHYKENGLSKIHLRNIGIDDILRSHLIIDGKLVNSSHKVSYQKDDLEKSFKIGKIEENIPYSWNALNKAVDLLELGFYNESLIVGFNLLDFCVQETLKQNMQNLEPEEKKLILRKIENQRLETYLGVFLKLITGRNVFNENLTIKDLRELNKFRNNIIHAGKNSTYHESAKYLQTIYKIVKSLNGFKMNYELQNRLIIL
jgi:hypothetical protein